MCVRRPSTYGKDRSLFKEVHSFENLFLAWRHVRQRARRSRNPDIRAAAEEFEQRSPTALRSIQSRIIAKSFVFQPSEGILKDKKKREAVGKLPRPIVLQDIESRVVQRALLQSIQPHEKSRLAKKIGALTAINNSTINYGGTPSGGVPRALLALKQAIESGHHLFFKSDIASFFTQVPHDKVLSFLSSELNDNDVVQLFRAALNVQLRNADKLQEYLELFPHDDIGVAQGSSLSALAGNIYLQDFDDAFASEPGVRLIRYIDDLIIVAKTNELLQAARVKAGKLLKAKKLNLYDPAKHRDKAAQGHLRSGVDFLGCAVSLTTIDVARSAKQKLLSKIRTEIENGKTNIRKFTGDAEIVRVREQTLSQTCTNLDNIIRGWANSFRFIENRLTFSQIDVQVHKHINEFSSWFEKQKFAGRAQKMRALGLFVLCDVDLKKLESFASDEKRVE
jgi:RNA-directed DNA polymerase